VGKKYYMEKKQLQLWQFDKKLFGRATVKLRQNKDSLESEKRNFINNMCSFIDELDFDFEQMIGRPRSNCKDIMKSALMMSYNSTSYRRTKSDLENMYDAGLISAIPPKSTMNDYINDLNTILLLERMIQFSAMFFSDNENTMILDSTWLGMRMYSGGYRKVYDKVSSNLDKCRKLHIAILKNSKVIACAKTSAGTAHDSPFFEELVSTVVKNGFIIERLIADSGYSSKENYALCKELGIRDAYIDFRSNVSGKRGKSDLWREKVKMWKEHKEIWHETYKYRVLVEQVFSAIKRKNINYIRARNDISQDVELLLKALVYNITIIGKYS
jgi:hypothetical protein